MVTSDRGLHCRNLMSKVKTTWFGWRVFESDIGWARISLVVENEKNENSRDVEKVYEVQTWFGCDSSWLSQICRAYWAITPAPLEGEEFDFAGNLVIKTVVPRSGRNNMCWLGDGTKFLPPKASLTETALNWWRCKASSLCLPRIVWSYIRYDLIPTQQEDL